ncbi:MAG: hypothetical protein KDB07_05665, partial [Planctomycetes bacterium]|nr:hypothetical protein [Planctomycetota bacterium]
MFYSLLRRLPFPEALVPWKMLRGFLKNRNYRLPEFKPQGIHGGSLEIQQGIPIARLRGSNYEIGKQHGALVGEQAAALFERYLGIFAGRKSHDLKLANKMLKHIPERYIEEMKGFSDGSGISWDDTLLTTTFLDIHKVALCSTFVVRDQSSSNGEIVFGRNLDFPALHIADRASMLFVVEPEGKRPFVSVGWPGFLGVLSGMNADGLALAMMLIYGHTRTDHVEGVPFALHYRDVLESYDNVKDASARLHKREFAVCNNMMLADASRDAAVLELHTRGVGEIRDDSDFPV